MVLLELLGCAYIRCLRNLHEGGTETLADELDRTASSFAERRSLSFVFLHHSVTAEFDRAVPRLDGQLETDCIPGRVSLDLLLLLSQQNSYGLR